MAYIKNYTSKGVTANYWTIMGLSTSKPSNMTNVTLRLYLNEEVRRANINDYLESIDVTLPGYGLTIEEVYPMIASADTIVDTFTTETVPAELDEEGFIVTPEYTRQVRTPFFSDAESDE